MIVYDLPAQDQAEIVLIGTGGGYGESCVIHYGENRWMVVDSCIDPRTRTCLPLEYLRKVGVDVENDVKLIICTHWHEDHIKGLSQLVTNAKNSKFCFGRATDRKKFLEWVALDSQKIRDRGVSASTKEFLDCLQILKNQRNLISQLTAEKVVERIPALGVQISALSPSDYVLEQFDAYISTLITEYGSPHRKYVLHQPNDKSVVMHLEFGQHTAILGADLEIGDDNRSGWLNILDHSTIVKGKCAGLIKIPHHGSENGYHSRIWAELLGPQPVAKLTPWTNAGDALPEAKMLDKYKNHTNRLYITAPILKIGSPKSRSRQLQKTITQFTKKLVEVKYTFGLIRSRIQIDDPTATWNVEIDGSGFQIS